MGISQRARRVNPSPTLAINAKAKLSILTKEVEEAVGLINPAEGDSPDKFTEETLEVILEINPDVFPEEAPKPVKKVAKKAAPVVEEEPEEEPEQEEEKPVKKAVVKKAAPAEEPEEEPEEEEKPAKGKKAAPFKSAKETLGTTRMIECAKAMASIKGSQTIDVVAKAADDKFVKAGGKTNVKQSKNIIKVILPAAEEWGVVVQKNGKLSNS